MTENATTNLSCIYDIRDLKLGYDWREHESQLQEKADGIISDIEHVTPAESARDHILIWLGQIDSKLTIIKKALQKRGFNHIRFVYNHRWNEDHTEILPNPDCIKNNHLRMQYILRDRIYKLLGTTTEMMIATTKYIVEFQKNAPKFRNIEMTTSHDI